MLKKYSLKEKESLLKKENVLIKNAFDLTLSSTYKIFIAIIDNNGEYSFFTRNETPNEFIENNLVNVKESQIKKVYTLKEVS
jgi:hypothetical protein